jgi:hypothetical protein
MRLHPWLVSWVLLVGVLPACRVEHKPPPPASSGAPGADDGSVSFEAPDADAIAAEPVAAKDAATKEATTPDAAVVPVPRMDAAAREVAVDVPAAEVNRRADAAAKVDASVDRPDAARTPTALCRATGGIVVQEYCCANASDFPNTCVVGVCSCVVSTLKTICECGDQSMCFVPYRGCVAATLPPEPLP